MFTVEEFLGFHHGIVCHNERIASAEYITRFADS
jgi:hypothetical protein